MNLFDIDAAILDCVDVETGEIIDVDKLEALEMARDAKISNIGCWIKELRAYQEAIRNEKKSLDKKLKVAENQENRLTTFIEKYLDGAPFKDGRVTMSYRKSTSTEIEEGLDLNTLPDYCKKITIAANKTAIKEALQQGKVIEGCSLLVKNNIQIR